jgi:hypothetical protein
MQLSSLWQPIRSFIHFSPQGSEQVPSKVQSQKAPVTVVCVEHSCFVPNMTQFLSQVAKELFQWHQFGRVRQPSSVVNGQIWKMQVLLPLYHSQSGSELQDRESDHWQGLRWQAFVVVFHMQPLSATQTSGRGEMQRRFPQAPFLLNHSQRASALHARRVP